MVGDVCLVISWDGGQSLLDKDHAADKARELKRRMSEMYDEELDTGRVCRQFCYHHRRHHRLLRKKQHRNVHS